MRGPFRFSLSHYQISGAIELKLPDFIDTSIANKAAGNTDRPGQVTRAGYVTLPLKGRALAITLLVARAVVTSLAHVLPM